MNIPFVDLSAQYSSIQPEIDQAIANVIEQTAFIGARGNSFVSQFENEFAQYLGVEHCVACANGTDALEMVLQTLDLSEDDEVIVPASSWFSTSEAVTTAGGRPVFVDVNQYNTIDVELMEKAINSNTRAIIPVHLYGCPADMERIVEIAKNHGVFVLEDCAQAHGAAINGKKVGSFGHAATFSFYPGKNLGAYGDAGAVVTNNGKTAETIRQLSNHGQPKKHTHLLSGRNSRMDGIQAAILSVKLKYIDQWNELRIKNAALYQKYLPAHIGLPEIPEGYKSVFHLYVIKTAKRDEVIEKLEKNGISTSIHYPTPLPLLDVYKDRNFEASDFPNSSAYCEQIISIPMYPEMTEEMIKYIAEVLG